MPSEIERIKNAVERVEAMCETLCRRFGDPIPPKGDPIPPKG